MKLTKIAKKRKLNNKSVVILAKLNMPEGAIIQMGVWPRSKSVILDFLDSFYVA